MPFVRVDGRSLEYEWVGEGAPGAPTLVFLHEGLGSIGQWRELPQRLASATSCAALVYSRYGHGQSDVLQEPRSPTYMHDEALRSLPELLAKLQVSAPVLVGHSDGASIALIHAGAGHAVRGLVLEAPHVFVEDFGLEGIREVTRAFAHTELRQRLGRYHRDVEKMFRGWSDIWLSPAFRDWNIEVSLRGIRCPVLVIQGADDEYGTMAQVDAIARQVRGPCELLKLGACGHTPHRDQPDVTLAAMSRFVAGLDLTVRR